MKKQSYIENFEALARYKIIFITPNVYVNNPDNTSLYQKHLSGWTIIKDFESLGYKIYGVGCRFVCGKWYKMGKIPLIIRPLFSLLSLFSTCITYYAPYYADHLICIKKKCP